MTSSTRAACLASLGAAALALAACAELKMAQPENGDNDGGGSSSSESSSSEGSGSAGASADASSGDDKGGSSPESGSRGPGTTGPGSYGALPFGYCCTANDDCRSRNCAQVGAQKMCLDACNAPWMCAGKGLPQGFTCDGSQFAPGTCRPPSAFACAPASTFVTGTKPTGACCSPTGDALNGIECAGGFCDQFTRSADPAYEAPFFCSNRCEVPADCGQGMRCHFEVGRCVPANEPFVCQ